MADLRIVDALARLQLVARRGGYRVVVTHAPRDLVLLVDLCGLGETLRVEPRRQPEQREQHVGVEEERELDEPPV